MRHPRYFHGVNVSLLVISLVTGWTCAVENDEQLLLAEMQEALTVKLLDVWYPASIDTVYGGFLSDFTYDWQPQGSQNKMLVKLRIHCWPRWIYPSSSYQQRKRLKLMRRHKTVVATPSSIAWAPRFASGPFAVKGRARLGC